MPTLLDILEAQKNDPDKRKIFTLVFPGGAMRGAYSAGAMIPLISHDLVEVFNNVIGVSAGAINAAYFLDEYTSTISAYINDLTTKQFVNLLRKDKKVDVDYAIDEVMKGKHPFNVKHLASTKVKLHIILTDAKNGKKVVISDHSKFEEIYQELRATAALPVLYDKQILYKDKYYIDGAVADALPIDVAIKLGSTDVVVLLNQQLKGYHFDRKHRRLERHLMRLFAKDQPEAIQKILPTDEKLLQVNVRRLLHPKKKVNIYILEPTDEEMMVSIGSIDKKKIEKLAHLGIADMEIFLSKGIK